MSIRISKSGYHVVRQSMRTWAGLSTDLLVEQVLMRSLKNNGGLSRGCDMTEQQRVIWLLSMPACAKRSMQEITGVKYNTREQNKEMNTARQQRDMKDMKYTHNLLMALSDRSPFDDSTIIRNLITGVHARN